MELPQSRPFGAEGRKRTHDFLSLYSPAQQDPKPSQGGCLKTHDFLQPLERLGKSKGKEENATQKTSLEKTQTTAPTPSVEHLLPGGIGTYTISHVSHLNQRVPKLESSVFSVAQASSMDRNEENSNCSSYSGSGFTLWEECAVKKGKTGKENISGDSHVLTEAGVKNGGQWMSERPSLSSSNNHSKNTTFSSFISTQQSLAQKSQNLTDNIRSAKVPSEVEDDDDDEDFILKKEPSSDCKGNLTIKLGDKCTNQKACTPRSKHSATEQRRRSKINDRFQMLREIIPHSDQKRDKASFLLEVIEYVQFLQEKVNKYEGSYQGWNHFPAKLMPWRNNHGPTEGFVDQSRAVNNGSGPALMFAEKLEENNIAISPAIPRNAQNQVGSDMSTATAFKAIDHQPGLTNKVMVPLRVPLQPNIFAYGGSSGAVAPLAPRHMSDVDHIPSQPQSQLRQSRSCTTGCTVGNDKLKEQDLTIDSGTISISSAYSQGLLNTLAQALQSSGVDLSQASISVQIDLGKRANSGLSFPTCTVKDGEVPSNNQGLPHSRAGSGGDKSEQALKRLKT